MLIDKFDKSWIDAIGKEKLKAILTDTIQQVYLHTTDFNDLIPDPESGLLFEVFNKVPLNKVKCVVLGMDPYHDGSYIGRAFGNNPARGKISPSLRNILKEVTRTYGEVPDVSLEGWEKQGVLLLNAAHTVIRKTPGSHLALWADFTELILTTIDETLRNKVLFILMGNAAKNYAQYLKYSNIIYVGHPSPLNRTHPFVGSDAFIQADHILNEQGTKIDWTI